MYIKNLFKKYQFNFENDIFQIKVLRIKFNAVILLCVLIFSFYFNGFLVRVKSVLNQYDWILIINFENTLVELQIFKREMVVHMFMFKNVSLRICMKKKKYLSKQITVCFKRLSEKKRVTWAVYLKFSRICLSKYENQRVIELNTT